MQSACIILLLHAKCYEFYLPFEGKGITESGSMHCQKKNAGYFVKE
jgi:hypothetical protein